MTKLQLLSKDRQIFLGWLDHFFNLCVTRDYTDVSTNELSHNRFRIDRFVLIFSFVYIQQKNVSQILKHYS